MKQFNASSFYLLIGLTLVLFWFCPAARADEIHEHEYEHEHEHGAECSVCDQDHNHDLHEHQVNDSAREAINDKQKHHAHNHTGPAKCPICGHDHDESEHNKELEMIKYETLAGKEDSLNKRAATMLTIALILVGFKFVFKTR